MSYPARVVFHAFAELLKLSLQLDAILAQVGYKSLELLNLRLVLKIVYALPNDILDELVVIVVLHERLQVLGRCLCDSVQLHQVVLRVVFAHILH